MEATLSSEASVNFYRIRLRHISEDSSHICEHDLFTCMRISSFCSIEFIFMLRDVNRNPENEEDVEVRK
jgi:hypothetical protein